MGALQMFDLMDKDKGGSLGADEVKQLMDMLGMKVSPRIHPFRPSTQARPGRHALQPCTRAPLAALLTR